MCCFIDKEVKGGGAELLIIRIDKYMQCVYMYVICTKEKDE